MGETSNEEYLMVLAALGATLKKHKTDLALARYDVDRLRKKLDEAQEENKRLKGE